MKLKTTAIALAVAGTVAAPVAVHAGADEVYASARVGVWYRDLDATDQADFDVRSFASRFGARGETDLGNGLTGFGRYEWGVDFNNGGGSPTTRHRYVGLKGDFGSVTMGQAYHTWYNYVVGPLDNPWWHSGYTMVEYRGRTDKGITYSGGAGAVSFGVTAYLQEDGEETAPDGLEAGLSFGLGDSTLAVAFSQVDEDGAGIKNNPGAQGTTGDDEDIVGIAWSGIGIGDTSLGVSYMMQDDDEGLVLDWGIGNMYVHAELLMLDAADADPMTITLGYTQSLGRKTTMYYEAVSIDSDGIDDPATYEDSTRFMAVLKYDII